MPYSRPSHALFARNANMFGALFRVSSSHPCTVPCRTHALFRQTASGDFPHMVVYGPSGSGTCAHTPCLATDAHDAHVLTLRFVEETCARRQARRRALQLCFGSSMASMSSAYVGVRTHHVQKCRRGHGHALLTVVSLGRGVATGSAAQDRPQGVRGMQAMRVWACAVVRPALLHSNPWFSRLCVQMQTDTVRKEAGPERPQQQLPP